MLRAEIYINHKKIDEVRIVNQGKKNKKGETIYKVINEPLSYYVSHKREEGWEKLLIKALEIW